LEKGEWRFPIGGGVDDAEGEISNVSGIVISVQ
jgi:hypothetical protein